MTGGKVPLVRTPKQQKAAAKALEKKQAEADLAVQETAAKKNAAELAQIVNLHIAGYSLADIGASIGASADEVDRLLSQDATRYIRSQPALRTYVRNYVSGKYNALLAAVWDEAVDPTAPKKLENQDRALRILDRMAKLHGADAPTQAEIKVDAVPENVEKMVKYLAAGQGLGYDSSVFDDDVIDGTVLTDVVEEQIVVSGNAVEESDGDDDF